jgi:hypothetical protein
VYGVSCGFNVAEEYLFFFYKKKVFLKEINFFCFKLIKKNIF